MTRLVVLLGLVLAAAAPARAGSLAPNELGRVMILEYHRIGEPEDRWTRTPDNLRRDLERLYAGGYRLIGLNDLVDGRIAVPAGTTPVLLTFDDSSPGQFRYIEKNGTLTIDPDCAVGILEAFAQTHPDFGLRATFFVLPGASPPNRLFDQPTLEGRKLQYLAARGFEIGNHTLWHANLGKYPEPVVRAQIAEAQEWIRRHLPDYKIRTLALPHGVYPKQVGWALRGAHKGTIYQHAAILMVSGGAAPSPYAKSFDPVRLPRIQALSRDLSYWLTYFERRPDERFVSDGDPAVVTIPKDRRDRLRPSLPVGLRIIERD